jgi:hypothetical protein
LQVKVEEHCPPQKQFSRAQLLKSQCQGQHTTQLYCPPATGYSEHISAIEYATHNETTLIPIQPQIMTGGPPALTPVTKTPPRALQLHACTRQNLVFPRFVPSKTRWHGSTTYHVTMEKLKPIIPSNPKERLSSMILCQ